MALLMRSEAIRSLKLGPVADVPRIPSGTPGRTLPFDEGEQMRNVGARK